MIEDTPAARWIARGVLLALFILGFWWLYKRKEYHYKGITSYRSNSIMDVLENTVKPFISQQNQTKKKKQKRVNKTEEMCRKIIEKIYNKPFPSIRPDFLKSPVTKKNLEIDCYNEELRIGLEYNGKQHYTYTPHFHRNKKNFLSQVHRDDWKRKKCRELGIRLIEIPYWVVPVDLEDYIKKELRKKGCL